MFQCNLVKLKETKALLLKLQTPDLMAKKRRQTTHEPFESVAITYVMTPCGDALHIFKPTLK